MSCAATGHSDCVFPFTYNGKLYTGCTMDAWTACWCAKIYDFRDADGTWETCAPTPQPTPAPTKKPTNHPSKTPTKTPTRVPSHDPTKNPTKSTIDPTKTPSYAPSQPPTLRTGNPSTSTTSQPTTKPTKPPTVKQTKQPTRYPSFEPSFDPSFSPIALFTSSIDPILSTEYNDDTIHYAGVNEQVTVTLNYVILAMGIVIFGMIGVFIRLAMKYTAKRRAFKERVEAASGLIGKMNEKVNANEKQMRAFSVNSAAAAPPAHSAAVPSGSMALYNNNANDPMQMRSFSVNNTAAPPFYNNNAMAAPAAVGINIGLQSVHRNRIMSAPVHGHNDNNAPFN